MKARIIKIISKEYTVLAEDGQRHIALLSGKIRRQTTPATGDMVEVSCQNNDYVIQKICPRQNCLIRPFVANVDQALIIMSVKDPDFSPSLIDRLCILIEKAGSLNPEIPLLLEGKVSVLTGQSGAGKSTLINELDPDFHLATQEISKALGRGKHTTRHNELHSVCGGLVADTPGFSSLDFDNIESDELGSLIPDFQPYIGNCRFNDCIHQNEPGCAIKEAVENGRIPLRRYNDYLSVLTMIQERRRKY